VKALGVNRVVVIRDAVVVPLAFVERDEQQLCLAAYFSPSWTGFQADGGRDFNVVVDGVSV
jgi:hypothetical protein